MQKIVINKCYGGFGLSDAARERLRELLTREGLPLGEGSFEDELSRDDPRLIRVVEEMGKDSWGKRAQLVIIEIPDGVDWEVEDYDGKEWVAEKHRVWQW